MFETKQRKERKTESFFFLAVDNLSRKKKTIKHYNPLLL